MHRAGTSVTTAILNTLGVSLSEDLMPPTQFNAMGYFESIAISKIHDDLLAALGSSWNTSELFVPFPHNWWRAPLIAPFKQRLIAQVSGELRRVPGIWGFKDPRTARLLPLWKDIIAEMGLNPRYVLVVRDPSDVAKSLHAREQVHPVLSELLWLEHYTDVITQLGSRVHAIVDYAGWFSNPAAQADYLIRALDVAMPPQADIESALARTISSELRHHQANGPAALPYSRELYSAMAQRDAASMEMLAQLFEVNKTFGSKMVWLAHQQSNAQLANVQQVLLQARSRIAALEQEVSRMRVPAHLQE
jgi:hypothetical protein